MSVPLLWFLGVFLLIGTVYDLRYRILPNSLTVAAFLWGVLGHALGWWTWHGWWMLGAAVPFLLATIPMGDVKGVMIVGGLVGPLVVPVVGVSLMISLLLFEGYARGWWRYPGDQPFFPYIAGATCGTILSVWVSPIPYP